MKQEYKYQLARRGKWICPQCHHKTFVCYVDADGKVLNDGVGKCDRADNCAYHYPPRDYFKDNGIVFDAKTSPRLNRQSPMAFKPIPRPQYINPDILKLSLKDYDNNNLIVYLNAVMGSAVVDEMIEWYYIGTSDKWNGATVFWQIDQFNHIHRGKVMLFHAIGHDREGKRVKEPFSHITSIHSVMNLGDNKPPECLFGEHLLHKFPQMTVGVCESEKTAIIANGCFGDCLMMACGGCGKLTAAMCKPLRGRDVILFPDNGKFKEWCDKGRELRHIFRRLWVADIMEREAAHAGDDLADLILERYYKRREDCMSNNFGFLEL